MVVEVHAPMLVHGSRLCDVTYFGHRGRSGPGIMTGSDRGVSFFSATLLDRESAGDDFRDEYAGCMSDHMRTRRKSERTYKFDCDIKVIVEAKLATTQACRFFLSDSSVVLCGQPVPVRAIRNIMWGGVECTIWRRGALDNSTPRAVLRQNKITATPRSSRHAKPMASSAKNDKIAFRPVSLPCFRLEEREAPPAIEVCPDIPVSKKAKHADESDAANTDTEICTWDDMMLERRPCRCSSVSPTAT